MRRIIVACLLLSGCQASPSLPPYLNAASECGGRSLAPAAYAESDYIVFVNNLIRANTQADIEARRRRLAEWAAAALSDPPGYQPPIYQPAFAAPATLTPPSVFVAPIPPSNLSNALGYVPRVQPAPQFVPAFSGSATGAGGYNPVLR
jgi:hypothetical protein